MGVCAGAGAVHTEDSEGSMESQAPRGKETRGGGSRGFPRRRGRYPPIHPIGSLGAVACMPPPPWCTEYATATALRLRYWRKDGKTRAASNREGKRVD
jgi:hypothetical protein